jgi:2-keto-4-pentenoate hydratase/2-oxohepta-3-ene-1,7-dioic acid hydratase in catechol pathway
MRIANAAGRLVIVAGDQLGLDVETASDGRFSADPQAVFDRWDEFCAWAAQAPRDGARRFELEDLGPPTPWPRQVFAIGLNYGDHIAETGSVHAAEPPIFTKYASSITGPHAAVEHPGGNVDWEVELVVVIGRHAHRAAAADAWSHVAGLTVGQDISERVLQHAGSPPQFSFGKSYPGFAPMGPWLVTPDELDDPDDLALGCSVNGESVQDARTSLMLLSVSALVERLSAVTPLLPGDIVFTGTPSGVGLGRTPERYLSPGDELVSHIEGIGEMRTRIVSSDS